MQPMSSLKPLGKFDKAWSTLVEGDEQPYQPCGKST